MYNTYGAPLASFGKKKKGPEQKKNTMFMGNVVMDTFNPN